MNVLIIIKSIQITNEVKNSEGKFSEREKTENTPNT
jgi:hypothetical protein